MNDEQRCEHGWNRAHNELVGPGQLDVERCPGPPVGLALRSGADREGDGWLPDTVPAAPSVSTDRTDERRAALADLEHVLTLALCEIDDEDKAAAVEQFRGDMLALGVRADELDAAGLTEYPPKDTA